MSAALLSIAYEYGRLAFERGAARVPALDPEISRMLARGRGAVELLRSWMRGWDAGNLRSV